MKKILSILLRVGISIALVAFLFYKVDRRSLLGLIANTDKLLLLSAFLITSLNYILCLFRWGLLLEAVELRLPLRRVISSFSGGVFFNLFLPSTIGGDLVRSTDLAIHTQRPHEVVATVLLDRLSGYIGLVIMALLSLLFGWRLLEDKSIMLSLSIIIGLLIAVLSVLFNTYIYSRLSRFLQLPGAGPVREAISKLHQELYRFRDQKKAILKTILLSLLIQSITPVSFYIIALSLGVKVGLPYFFIFLPIIGAITLLPISIGGLGLRDVTTIFFFAKAGVAKDLAFAMSLLSFVFVLIYGLLGGLIYVFALHRRRM